MIVGLASARPTLGTEAVVCANLPVSKFQLFMIEGPKVEEDFDAEPERLHALRADPDAGIYGRSAHLALLLQAKPTAFVRSEGGVVEQNGAFCAAPRAVRIGIGLTRRSVHLLRAAAANPCVRRELVAHANRHLQADESVLEEVLERTRGPFGAALPAFKTQPAETAELAAARFEASVRTSVDLTLAALAERRAEVHAAIDGDPELRRLHAACTGDVARMNEAALAGFKEF